MYKLIKTGIIGLLLSCFVLIRAFENQWFYDPLLQYFKGDHLLKPLPKLDLAPLFISYTLRYGLNMLISFLILKVVFQQVPFFKSILAFYIAAFLLLSFLLFSILLFEIEVGNLMLFYLRRFLIQPIFILILFPFLYLLQKGYRFDDV